MPGFECRRILASRPSAAPDAPAAPRFPRALPPAARLGNNSGIGRPPTGRLSNGSVPRAALRHPSHRPARIAPAHTPAYHLPNIADWLQLGFCNGPIWGSMRGGSPSSRNESKDTHPMYRLWLTFVQTATICLALLFVVATLKPEWLPGKPAVPVQLNQAAAPAGTSTGDKAASYSDAVRRAA